MRSISGGSAGFFGGFRVLEWAIGPFFICGDTEMPRESTELRTLVEPAVNALGFELVGVEFSHGKPGLLRIYIDSEDGITVHDCEAVSHQVSGLLDVEDPIAGHYSLEVSSPGLDRPLFQARDFERFAGHTVRLRLTAPLNGRRKFKGVLRGMKDNQVVVQMDDEQLSVGLDEIDQARLVPDYESHRSEGA
jgi:ribosome maturation factor RimP